MFKINDYVVYGSTGVCQIIDISKEKNLSNDEIQYYVLQPETIVTALKAFPLVFIIAMILEKFIVGKVADKLVNVFSLPTDSFNSHILFRTFFTVIGMSIIMTNVGGILASGFSLEVIKEFPINWPRNFCVVIFLELLIVQPIARTVMRIMHDKNETHLDDRLSA